MPKSQKGLGRGLNVFFGDDVKEVEEVTKSKKEKDHKELEKVVELNISEVEPTLNQPRKVFDKEKLEELANSIKENGVLQPILVVKDENGYTIVAGERRWRAAKIAGLKVIPAIIKDYTDSRKKQVALIENIQREDLNPYEKALGIRNLMDKYGLTQEEVSKRIGKSRSAVSNTVRILNLAPDVLEFVKQGKLTEGHCKALAAITDQKRQYEMAVRMIERGESVRQAEQKNLRAKKEKYLDPKYKMLYDDIEDKFQGFFGTKVKLDQGKRKGRIIIEYNGNADLERILDLIK